jgi:glycosyltransferase involved in cell wall biosynthesis
MKVLFLMFAFPDMNNSFNMYTALVDMFYKNGNQVTIVAPATDLKSTGIKTEKGIEVLRVKTLPIKNVSNIRKGIANILLPYQYKRALDKFYKNQKFDLIIIPTPPITLGSLAASLKKKHNSQVYLILRDIFPQNAVDLGFMKSGFFVHKFFTNKEKKLYNTADHIGCMSQANIDYLRENSEVPSAKLHILRNWQYLNEDSLIDMHNIKKEYDLLNKFVVVFGGNMGKPQQLENVIELVLRCKLHEDIVFVLLGEGVMMDKIQTEANLKNLNNIKIYRSIAKLKYQALLRSCDVGLISLHEDFTIPNIPSKALDYWNLGLPILASIDRATDFGQVLDETQSGLWSYAGKHKELHDSLIKLYDNKELRKRMSDNGKIYFKEFLTPEMAYSTIVDSI